MNKNKVYVAEISERPVVSIDRDCFKKVPDHAQKLKEIKDKGIQPMGIRVVKTY